MAATPDKAAVIAEAYRRGLLPPDMAASYEAAARQGIVNDPYAAARAEGRGQPVTGYLTTAARAIPGVTELGAGWSAALRSADDLASGRAPDFGARYSQARAQQQGLVDQFRADHPIASNNAAALGLVAPTAATLPMGAAPAAARLVAPVASRSLGALAGRVAAGAARNAFTGGVVGATYGFGQGESLQEREANAARGVLPGAAMGVAAPMAVGAARGLLALRRPLTVPPPPVAGLEREPWINHYAIDTDPDDDFDEIDNRPLRQVNGPPTYGRDGMPISRLPANSNVPGGRAAVWERRVAGYDPRTANPEPIPPGQTPPDNVIASRYAKVPNDFRAPGSPERKAGTGAAGNPAVAPGSPGSIVDGQPGAAGTPPGASPAEQRDYDLDPTILGPWGATYERIRRLAAFNERMANFGLSSLGKSLPYEIGAGPEAVNYLGAETAKAYDTAASRVKSFGKDPQLIAATQVGYNALADASDEARNAYKAFLIDHMAPQISAGNMTGRDVLDLQSNIADWANIFKRHDYVTHPVGIILDHLNNHVTDAVDRQNPGYASAKRAADDAAAIHSRLVRASAMALDNGGVYTPDQLHTALDLEAQRQGDIVTSAKLFPMREMTRHADVMLDSQDPSTLDKIASLAPRSSPYRSSFPYQWSVRDLPAAANDYKATNAFALRQALSSIDQTQAGQTGLAPSWVTAGSYLAQPNGQPDSQ